MDLKIENGGFAINEAGLPETVSGLEEILQQAEFHLRIKKGSYPYNRALGSRLNEVDTDAERAKESAISFANEALLKMGGVSVYDVQIIGEKFIFDVLTPLGNGQVEIKKKIAESDV
jgi:hypothetical protein